MGCSNSTGDIEHSNLIKLIIKCTVYIISQVENYKLLYSKSKNEEIKFLINSIIIDKNNHIAILKEIYKLAKGDNLVLSDKNHSNVDSNILSFDKILNTEFNLIQYIKILRSHLPSTNLHQHVNNILIDENLIISKILYLKK